MAQNVPSSPSPSDDSDFGTLSSTPTPFSQLHRTLSHTSWSASETPQHHNQGTSYFPNLRQQPPPPILVHRSSSAHSMRRGHRSTSISSTSRAAHRDEDPLSEEDEEVIGEGNRRSKPAAEQGDSSDDVEESSDTADDNDDPMTLKDRQSLINVEHPFGLPIWKPALYKKSRSVTRYADEALHSIPSAQAERHLLPGNIFWVLFFGWWMSLTCFAISGVLHVIPQGGKRYSSLVFGLGWYLAWPFGKYVEGDAQDDDEVDSEGEADDEASGAAHQRTDSVLTARQGDDESGTIRAVPHNTRHVQSVSWNPVTVPTTENSSLIRPSQPARSYGAASLPPAVSSTTSSIGVAKQTTSSDVLGKICFWLSFICIIAPLILIVCLICWGLVVTIPMAKLNWALLKHLFERPTSIRFCSAPPAVVVSAADMEASVTALSSEEAPEPTPRFSVKHPRIRAGQIAPSGSPSSKVLLCTYRAVGKQYYKYTVGGVNIMFINLLPVVFFVIFDGLFILPLVEQWKEEGKHVPPFLALVASQALIFVLSLLSVIPLSYFIGMAVASISAQSSIGMGAVINATFGSIIEIILYSLALTQGKGHLVEGSIVGSLLAGVLLMPGMSMVSSALRRKEQKFNAKSAGVTSMMLIMAIIGILTPTLFYQTYGTFKLVCSGCPSAPGPGEDKPWICDKCYYEHPDPVDDPFYQSTVKSLMYFCAVILVLSYLIGLWFSLRTHASQIWQNPQQLLQPDLAGSNSSNRQSLYHRILPSDRPGKLHHKASTVTNNAGTSRPQTPVPRERDHSQTSSVGGGPRTPVMPRRVSYAPAPVPSPVLESVENAVRSTAAGLHGAIPTVEPGSAQMQMTTDEFTRAVAVATVSALRHQHQSQAHAHSPARGALRGSGVMESEGGGHGGHDAPNWSRTTSASVLLACTALYAMIAEILVEVVDVILDGSGIDEKFLGVTIFALVPNTTEFMNAISFALNGNIALSMEIGSAYALQVCLLQIPAMVAFSAWWAPEKMGEVANTFTLVFPRWDVVVIILSMFLMTYTYIEAKSNYHRGSILILSYLVLAAGFYFAPHGDIDLEQVQTLNGAMQAGRKSVHEFVLSGWQYGRWCLTSWMQ